ncbi:MAG: hypothetical protein J5590_08955 [Clostridia bacterium]|nr:hypothetical protein [Clostridia bacterium]
MKSTKGSLTVEAMLSVSAFIMVYITILFIMRLVFAYEIVQHALNQTAKEFSTYGYYNDVSGLGDVNGTLNKSTAGGVDNFNKNVSNVVNLYDKINNLGDSAGELAESASNGDIEGVITNIDNNSKNYSEFKDAAVDVGDMVKDIAEDPVATIKSIGSVLLRSGNENTKTLICGAISKRLMAKYIEDGGYDAANERLKKLRIVDGLEGIDLSGSKFWSPEAEDEIELVACYTIKPVFPVKVLDEVNFVNKVRVRCWRGNTIFE